MNEFWRNLNNSLPLQFLLCRIHTWASKKIKSPLKYFILQRGLACPLSCMLCHYFPLLGIEPGASYMLVKCLITELHPPNCYFLAQFNGNWKVGQASKSSLHFPDEKTRYSDSSAAVGCHNVINNLLILQC